MFSNSKTCIKLNVSNTFQPTVQAGTKMIQKLFIQNNRGSKTFKYDVSLYNRSMLKFPQKIPLPSHPQTLLRVFSPTNVLQIILLNSFGVEIGEFQLKTKFLCWLISKLRMGDLGHPFISMIIKLYVTTGIAMFRYFLIPAPVNRLLE